MPPTLDEVNDFIARQFPAAHRSGVVCLEVGERHSIARWNYDPATLRPGGLISGPTQFALADVALYYAVFGAIGIEPMAVTADLMIRFLRPAMGGDLVARADLFHVGRSRISGEVRLWVADDPGRVVSHATGTYVVANET